MFERERRVIEDLLGDLLVVAPGKFAVVTTDGLAGLHATETDAFKAAIRAFGRAKPFFIAPVIAKVAAEVPALALGLIDDQVPWPSPDRLAKIAEPSGNIGEPSANVGKPSASIGEPPNFGHNRAG